MSWTPPSGEPAVTGYIIYYQQDGGQRLSLSAGPNATTATFTGLFVHVRTIFSITIVATSSTLPSVETAAQTITITLNGECITPLHYILYCHSSLHSSPSSSGVHISCQWTSHCWPDLLPHLHCAVSITSGGGALH